jgi:hypothetical protein
MVMKMYSLPAFQNNEALDSSSGSSSNINNSGSSINGISSINSIVIHQTQKVQKNCIKLSYVDIEAMKYGQQVGTVVFSNSNNSSEIITKASQL